MLAYLFENTVKVKQNILRQVQPIDHHIVTKSIKKNLAFIVKHLHT